MKTLHARVALAIGAVALALAVPAAAQTGKAEAPAPGEVIVSIYHVAPGKHLDFLKWMAAREAANKELGLATGQWYVHGDGDSWDFVAISPQLTEVDDKRIDELLKKKGLKTGFPAALEFRQFIASHTDTFATGPQSVSEILKAAGGN